MGRGLEPPCKWQFPALHGGTGGGTSRAQAVMPVPDRRIRHAWFTSVGALNACLPRSPLVAQEPHESEEPARPLWRPKTSKLQSHQDARHQPTRTDQTRMVEPSSRFSSNATRRRSTALRSHRARIAAARIGNTYERLRPSRGRRAHWGRGPSEHVREHVDEELVFRLQDGPDAIWLPTLAPACPGGSNALAVATSTPPKLSETASRLSGREAATRAGGTPQTCRPEDAWATERRLLSD